MTKYGLGFHTDDIRHLPQAKELIAKLGILKVPALFIGSTVTWISKLSFFITLLRIVTTQAQRTIVWFVMITSSALIFVLSIIQPFAECETFVVKVSNDNPDQNCIPSHTVATYNVVALSFTAATVR